MVPNSHERTGAAAREGSGAFPLRPGHGQGRKGHKRGASPAPSGAPRLPCVNYTASFTSLPGPRHSPMVRPPSARLCCWGAHGVEREPSFVPWCHGERAVLPTSAALNPTGSCFPFPRGTGSVAIPEKCCVALLPSIANEVQETPVALGRVCSFWQ